MKYLPVDTIYTNKYNENAIDYKRNEIVNFTRKEEKIYDR